MPPRASGNYFRFLAAVHPQHGIPHRSLVALGLVAACLLLLHPHQVITMLVITRILLQFFLQQVGVMLLRVQRPELQRPFRIPLYPLPPLAAMAGFIYSYCHTVPCDWRTGSCGGHRRFREPSSIVIRARRLGQWPFRSSRGRLAPV